ncbi:MAG: extracellular solute-binding protein [Caldilineaceae bacterium]
MGLIYNEQMFADAGLDVPNENWTWDDLRRAAETLTDSESGLYGLSLSPDFARLIAFIYQAGWHRYQRGFHRDDHNSPEAQDAINFYVNLVLDGYAAVPADLDSGWPGEAFGRETRGDGR